MSQKLNSNQGLSDCLCFDQELYWLQDTLIFFIPIFADSTIILFDETTAQYLVCSSTKLSVSGSFYYYFFAVIEYMHQIVGHFKI
jgi:hypothetical protein